MTKSQITNKFQKFRILNLSYWRLFVICFLVLGALFSSVAMAHVSGSFWVPGEPIVPCGGPGQPVCTQCELLHLVRHLIDFIMVAAAPILATFFFVVAGVYLMLGADNPGMLSQGKRIFKDTFIGIAIVMLAWLITNTLIRTLMDPSVTQGTNWWEISCSQIGLKNTPPGTGGQQPVQPPPPPPPPSIPSCRLESDLVVTPSKSSYSVGETIQISVLSHLGCVGSRVEVRVGPRTGFFVDWNQGIVVANPIMTSPCVNTTSCVVSSWTVNKFNANADEYSIRAVTGNGSGGTTEAYMRPSLFTITP